MSAKDTKLDGLLLEKKALNVLINSLQQDRNLINIEVKNLSQRMSILDQKIARESKKAKSNKEKRAAITDHALLRYLERVHNFNIEEIKKQLLSDNVKTHVKRFKSGKVTENGITFIFKDGVIITIVA